MGVDIGNPCLSSFIPSANMPLIPLLVLRHGSAFGIPSPIKCEPIHRYPQNGYTSYTECVWTNYSEISFRYYYVMSFGNTRYTRRFHLNIIFTTKRKPRAAVAAVQSTRIRGIARGKDIVSCTTQLLQYYTYDYIYYGYMNNNNNDIPSYGLNDNILRESKNKLTSYIM